MNNKMKWYIYAFISIALWSIHAVIIRYLVSDYWMSPFLIGFLRFFLWWIFLIFISIIFYKFSPKKLKKDLTIILKEKTLWLSSIFLFLNFLVFHLGLKYTFASNGIIIEALSPALVIILTLLFFSNRIKKDFSVIRKMFFVTFFATVWIALLINNTWTTLNSEYKAIWDLLAFLAMIFFAFFIIFNSALRNKLNDINWILITWVWLTIGALFMFLFTIWDFNELNNLDQKQVYLILLLCIWSTWILYLSWFMAARYINHITLSILVNIIWITTIITEFIIYKDNWLIWWKLILWTIIILWASVYTELLNKK